MKKNEICAVCGSSVGFEDGKCKTCKKRQVVFTQDIAEWIVSRLPNSKQRGWSDGEVWEWKEKFIEAINARTETLLDSYKEGWGDGFEAGKKYDRD